MPLPESFLTHLRSHGYNSRSNRHSNALAEAIVVDLLIRCEPMARFAKSGRLVYDLNQDLRFQTSTWNVDLVIGKPALPVAQHESAVARTTPITVAIAIELKAVMTEHRKAVKNRKRDFEAHHEHVHNYDLHAIAGGVMVVNASEQFRSSLRPQVTIHGDRIRANQLVGHCVNEMRNVTQSSGTSHYGMDAKAVIVVDFDNINTSEGRFWTRPPAPQVGDPLHYDSFIQKLCSEFVARFASNW